MNILTRNTPRQYLRNGDLNLADGGVAYYSSGLSGMTGGYLPALPMEEGGYLVEDPVTFMQNILIQGDTQIDGNLNINGEFTINGEPFEGGGAKELSSLEDVSIDYEKIKDKGVLQYNPLIEKWEHSRELDVDKIIIGSFNNIQTPNGDDITSLRRDYLSELWDVYIPDGSKTQPDFDTYPVQLDMQSQYDYRPMVALKAWFNDDKTWETIYTPAGLRTWVGVDDPKTASVQNVFEFQENGHYSFYWDLNGDNAIYYPIETRRMITVPDEEDRHLESYYNELTLLEKFGIVHSFSSRETGFNGDVYRTGKDDEYLGEEYNKGYTNSMLSTSLFVTGSRYIQNDGTYKYTPTYKLQSFMSDERLSYPKEVGGDEENYEVTVVLDQVELVHSENKETILNNSVWNNQTIKQLETQKVKFTNYSGDTIVPEIVASQVYMSSKDISPTYLENDPDCYFGYNNGLLLGSSYDRMILRTVAGYEGVQYNSHRDIMHFVYPETFAGVNNYDCYFMLDTGNFKRLMASSSGEYQWTVQRAKFLQNNYGTSYFTNDGKLYLYDYVNSYSGKLGFNADGHLVVDGIEGYYTKEELYNKEEIGTIVEDLRYEFNTNLDSLEVRINQKIEDKFDVISPDTGGESNLSKIDDRLSVVEGRLDDIELMLDKILGTETNTYLNNKLDEILEG